MSNCVTTRVNYGNCSYIHTVNITISNQALEGRYSYSYAPVTLIWLVYLLPLKKLNAVSATQCKRKINFQILQLLTWQINQCDTDITVVTCYRSTPETSIRSMEGLWKDYQDGWGNKKLHLPVAWGWWDWEDHHSTMIYEPLHTINTLNLQTALCWAKGINRWNDLFGHSFFYEDWVI